MLDNVINGSLAILQRAEHLIAKMHWLIASGNLDEEESLDLHREIESMTDVVLMMDEAVRKLRRAFDIRPEMSRVFTVHATVQ